MSNHLPSSTQNGVARNLASECFSTIGKPPAHQCCLGVLPTTPQNLRTAEPCCGSTCLCPMCRLKNRSTKYKKCHTENIQTNACLYVWFPEFAVFDCFCKISEFVFIAHLWTPGGCYLPRCWRGAERFLFFYRMVITMVSRKCPLASQFSLKSNQRFMETAFQIPSLPWICWTWFGNVRQCPKIRVPQIIQH